MHTLFTLLLKNFSDVNLLGYCIKCCKIEENSTENCSTCLTCQSNLVYKCKKCPKEYASKKSLHNHMYLCNQEMKFCSYCDYQTKHKRSLIEHNQEKHLPLDPTANKCARCGKSHASKSSLRQHLRCCGKSTKSGTQLLCAHCNYRTFEKENLSLHMTSKHLIGDPNNINCVNCGKLFTKLSGLKLHLKYSCKQKEKHESKAPAEFSCSFCEFKYKHKPSLARHIEKVHSIGAVKVNKCSKCQKSFSKQIGLLRHSKNCGKPKDSTLNRKPNFHCHHCGFECAIKKTLISHMQSKHMNLTFECTVCESKFGSELILSTHFKRNHTDPLNPAQRNNLYFCDHCEFKTKYKCSLACHIQATHSRKFYKCRRCGRSCKSLKNFNNHRKYCSSQPKSLMYCDHCEYKSSRKPNLANHILFKHFNVSFDCDACGKSFTREDTLKIHVRDFCKNVKR